MSQIEILLLFFILNLFLVVNFEKIKILKFAIDKPDKQRKFHSRPVALAGGIILIINILLYFIFLNLSEKLIINEIIFDSFYEFNIFILICLSIFFLGLVDDKINLNPNKKFLFLAIFLSLYLALDKEIIIKTLELSFLDKTIYLGKFSFIFTLFCFLVFLNAFNMFDGINLQSSTYVLVILLYFFSLEIQSLLILILIVFIIFFKFLNYSNKSFLGDGGTLLISFIISVFFIRLFNKGVIIHSDEIFIYLMIPGIDMIRLFFERIAKRRHPFSFDRNHIHHLLLSKFSYFNTIFVLIFLISAPIILNFLKVDKLIIIIFSIIIYFLLVLILKRNIKANQ